METTDIKALVYNSGMPRMRKIVVINFLNAAEDDTNARNALFNLIKEISREKTIGDIFLSTDDVKIFTVISKDPFTKDHPFRIITLKNGVWTRCAVVSRTLDEALLVYFSAKYLGENSAFVSFASKMLGMEHK